MAVCPLLPCRRLRLPRTRPSQLPLSIRRPALVAATWSLYSCTNAGNTLDHLLVFSP